MTRKIRRAVFLHPLAWMPVEHSLSTDVAAVFPGHGEMARRCRDIDWSATSLGPIDNWPDALRVAVRMAIESPFPVNLWCGTDLLLIYNDAYVSVLGAKHPRALGRPGRDVWSEIWPDIAPMFDRIRAGGPPMYAEDALFRMERQGGLAEPAWFTFALSPIRDDAGEIVGYFNPATETTQRVIAERVAEEERAAARRAEDQLRTVFAQAPAFLAVLQGPTHVFQFVNDAYRRLIGGRDVVGKPVAEALPEIRSQGFFDILDTVLHDNEPFVGRETKVMLERDGKLEERYVDFVYQPILDAAGAPSGIVAHGTDVTDSVRARKVVEESESRYRFMANAIPVQVWTATADGALDYVSNRAAAYFGKSADEVIGDQWLSVLHPDDVTPTMDRWRRSLETGEPYEVEFRLWSALHQGFRWHLGRATPERDAEGNVLRWVGTNTEIEERKQAEAELQRLTAEATDANNAKSAFLASMSHELRTPLNAIGGYAQLIEMGVRGPVNDEQRADLLKIQRSKNHLDRLVRDILSFAKMGAGRVEYSITKVNVAATVSAVNDMVAPQLAERGLRLDCEKIPRELDVRADQDKLRQILLNLLGNALKFTPEGGSIEVRVTPADDLVTISVRDTGIGIATDQLERVFEPFVQSKRALKASDQGVGLGLAISRQYARAMSGDLRAESASGKGSTFYLTLPRN